MPASHNFAAAHARKYKYLDDFGVAQDVSTYASKAFPKDADACGDKSSDRRIQLRDTLVAELNALATSACDVPCDEDKELDELMKEYEAHAKSLSGASTTASMCASFDNDPTIRLLNAKAEQLKSFSFAYLHGECEAAQRCNPHAEIVHTSLLACSGLMDGGVLFHDEALAKIGREIAGPQQARTLSPAANGFAASLFQTDTVAPGLNKSGGEPTYWVNVCFPTPNHYGMPGTSNTTYGVKWVPANPLEVAKYETLRHIALTIRKHKKRILQVNHQVFTLQRRLRNARTQSAQAYFARPRARFGGAAGSSGKAVDADMEMFVQETGARLKNQLRMRNSDQVPAFVPPAGFGQGGGGARRAQQDDAGSDLQDDAAQGDDSEPSKKSRSKGRH
jgi:hypothetical protein